MGRHVPPVITGASEVLPAVSSRRRLTAAFTLCMLTCTLSNVIATSRTAVQQHTGQYRTFITNLVNYYTAAGVVAIVDLHWNDDDTEQQPMAKKAPATPGDALLFWDSVASTFGENKMVFYELYNEPHISDLDAYMNGNAEYAGMLEMAATVRTHTADSVLLIAGADGYAYDADSLVTLDAKLVAQNAINVVWNFHPYMGPDQAGAANKCPAGFDAMLETVEKGTDRPAIITEFGQACCPTNGACEKCPQWTNNGIAVGYDEAIVQIAEKHSVSWIPWAWRPSAHGTNPKTCQDLNGGNANGTALGAAVNGTNGADFAALWSKYA